MISSAEAAKASSSSRAVLVPRKKPARLARERRWWAMMTLSRTLMERKIVVSWKVRTTPFRATRCGARLEMRSPLKRTSPEVVGTKEAIILKSVDLPAPFGPITERISRSATSKEMSLLAVSPP